jgi:hypothetical protein
MRRREKKKNERGGCIIRIISLMCEKDLKNHLTIIVNINIAVAELKNTDFRRSKQQWFTIGYPPKKRKKERNE